MVLPPGEKNSVENIGEWISRGNRIRALVSFEPFRGPGRTIGIVYKYTLYKYSLIISNVIQGKEAM